MNQNKPKSSFYNHGALTDLMRQTELVELIKSIKDIKDQEKQKEVYDSLQFLGMIKEEDENIA